MALFDKYKNLRYCYPFDCKGSRLRIRLIEYVHFSPLFDRMVAENWVRLRCMTNMGSQCRIDAKAGGKSYRSAT